MIFFLVKVIKIKIYYIFLDGIQWHFLINKIGEILTIPVIIELLISRCALVANWNQFCKTFKNCNDNIDLEEERLKALTGAVNSITSKLMNDDIVQTIFNNLLHLRKKDLNTKNCSLVSAEFTKYIKQAIQNLDKLSQERPNGDIMYKYIKINVLFAFNSHLFGSNDKKTFKSLVELNTKVCSKYMCDIKC